MKEEDINLILVWLERSLPKRVFAFFERTFVGDSYWFLRSCKVPLFLNFLRSLYRDLLEAGGGALAAPHVGAGHLMINENETGERERIGDYL